MSASGWSVITAVIAGAASLMAVVLGIEQLTSGTRLRNLEAMLRAAVAETRDDGQERVLASLHAATVARLVARDAVPSWRFALPSFVVTISTALVVVTWVFGLGQADFVPFAAISTFCGAFFIARGVVIFVNLARERARVARCYRKSVTPIRAFVNTKAAWESGGISVVWRAYALSVGLVTGVCGTVLHFANVRVLEPVPSALVTLGLLAVTGFGTWFREYVAKDKTDEPEGVNKGLNPTWTHPAAADVSLAQDAEPAAEIPV